MLTINMHQAKSQLSHFVDQAASGLEVIITSAGKPVARLVPLANNKTRQLGLGKGKFSMPKHFDTMHQIAIQQMFEDSQCNLAEVHPKVSK